MNPDLCTPLAYFSDLKARMQGKGISDKKLAAACDPPVAQSNFSRWMNGKQCPSLASIERLERALAKLSES